MTAMIRHYHNFFLPLFPQSKLQASLGHSKLHDLLLDRPKKTFVLVYLIQEPDLQLGKSKRAL